MYKNFSKLMIAVLFSTMSALCVNAQSSDTLNIRMMSYNLRFGELATLDEIGMHIKSFAPDFVALEEVDVNSYRGMAKHQNGKNFIAELSGATGMFAAFGKSINLSAKDSYYGIGLLSKYPIIKTEKYMLPNPRNTEQRVLLCAWVEMGNDTVVVASTHLCYLNEDTKFEQAGAIIEQMDNAGNYPKLVGGDFNTNPKSITYNRFIKNGWLETSGFEYTWPADAPRQKLDYIFAYPAKKWHAIKSYAIPSCLSDHLPIVVDLQYIK